MTQIKEIVIRVSYDHKEWIVRDIMKDWYYRLFKPDSIHMSPKRFEKYLDIEINYNPDGRKTHDVKLINVQCNEHISEYIIYLISEIKIS